MDPLGEQSLLDLHLDDVPELTPVPGGEEYELRVMSSKIEPSKSSERKVLKVMFSVNDHPEALPIFENLAFPLPEDDKSKADMFKRQVKNFVTAIGMDPKSPGKPEEWVGKTCWVFLKQGTNNKTGNTENKVSSYLTKRE